MIVCENTLTSQLIFYCDKSVKMSHDLSVYMYIVVFPLQVVLSTRCTMKDIHGDFERVDFVFNNYITIQ